MIIDRYIYNVIWQALHKIENNTKVSIHCGVSFLKHDKPLTFGVNWSAMGTRTPEEARDYATRLSEAADIAEMLNSLELNVDSILPATGTTETFRDDTKEVYEMIKHLNNNALTIWILERRETI